MDLSRPLKLICTAQNYAWGRRGRASLVARLADLDEDKPFAELWAGAHPKSCSLVELPDGSRVPLQEVISESPKTMLGERSLKRFGAQLPFLFKILSVGKPLSIQLHPDAENARMLHQTDALHYPDPNPKPEIAIALTEVSLLFGFRPRSELDLVFQAVPELNILYGGELEPDADLRQIHQRILRSSQPAVRDAALKLYRRLDHKPELTAEDHWVRQVQSDFPQGDVGLFYFYLLNLVRLAPGQAVFIRPNVPHAYLAGDLAECLANSDNVVRAGLTEKFRDIESLLRLADFSATDGGSLKPDVVGKTIAAYRPGIPEFAVELHSGEPSEQDLGSTGELMLIFSLSARGSVTGADFSLDFKPGDVFILPASLPGASLVRLEGQLFKVRAA